MMWLVGFGLLLVSGIYCLSSRWHKETVVIGAVLVPVAAVVLSKIGEGSL